jgi:hypothetical protein
MGGLQTKLSAFVEDLKHSWYFRVWAFLWLFFAIITFSSLIILGQRATASQMHPYWSTYIQVPDTLNFPAISVKTDADEPTNQIVTVSCFAGTPESAQLFVNVDLCPGGIAPSTCRLIAAEQVAASKTQNAVDCTVNITAPPGADTVLAFEFQEETDFGRPIIWIQPTDEVYVYISKTVVEPKGSGPITIWQHHLAYKNDIPVNNFFSVKFVFDNFAVFHFVEDKGFDSWLSVGGIGGFAYFMVLIHTAFMTLISICLTPESKFLFGEKGTQYGHL